MSLLETAVRELGPYALEVIKAGVDAILSPGSKASEEAKGYALTVRGILPDPLPNVALDDAIDRDIADAKSRGG
jgi:hypothetical protein